MNLCVVIDWLKNQSNKSDVAIVHGFQELLINVLQNCLTLGIDTNCFQKDFKRVSMDIYSLSGKKVCHDILWGRLIETTYQLVLPNPPDPTIGCLIMLSHSGMETRLHCPLPSSPGSYAWVSRHCSPICYVIKSTQLGIFCCSQIMNFLKFTCK